MRLLILLLLYSGVAFSQADQWKNVYSKNAWKERDAWQKPQELIRKMNIRQGSKVADIGCHEGYMSFHLSESVGPSGKVYAVDVDDRKLEKLNQNITDQKALNIIAIKGDYDDPHLPAGQLDAVIIMDTYHEMDDHDKILMHVKATLKKDGRLVLCEPIEASRKGLSREDQEKKHELEMKYALEDLQRAGFRILESKSDYIDREKIKGDMMWLIVATPGSL